MPERWEHELKKLRKIEQPSTLEDRVAEGPHPHHEPGRPTRERVAAAVVAFAVCAAVGVVGYRTLSNDDARAGGSNIATGVPTGDEPLVLELATSLHQPSATLLYGDEHQDGIFEFTNWCPNGVTGPDAECSSSTADFAFFPPVNAFLVVPPGTPIELTGNGSVAAWQIEGAADGHAVDGSESGETPLARVPGVDGRYAINVGAHWSLGDANVWFGVQVLSSESAAPDMLTVDCSLGLAQTDTSVVRTQPNGLAIQVVNDNGVSDVEVRSEDGQVASRAAGLDDNARVGWGAAPGRYTIGCDRDPSPDAMVPFELVDPDDHYVPWELACGDLPGTPFSSTIPTTTSADDAAARIVGGLADGDRLRGAGYGAETWRLGPTYVVDRGGEAVARLVLGEQLAPGDGEGPPVWGGTLAVCDGSGIAIAGNGFVTTPAPPGPDPSPATAPAEPTGATAEPLPEELVVRCEGLGPAVDRTDVRLQPDGLHVEATNVADAEAFVIASPTTEASAGPFSFDRITQRVVVDLPPGTYSVGCLVPREDGTYPGRDEAPDAYVTVEVLPEGA